MARAVKLSLGFLGSVGVIELKALFDSWKGVKFAAVHHDGIIAMGTNKVWLVRNNDHGAVRAFFKKLVLATLPESVIAYGHDFIDQITIKLDGHRESKGEPGAHARRIGFDRLIEIATQLRKILNIRDLILNRSVIYSANESEIIQTRQGTL